MKRRSVLKSLPVLAGAPLAAQSAPENFKIASVPPDAAAKPVQRFFSAAHFATLSRLGELLVPSFNERPGSAESRAALFLDFLISKSPERQRLYRAGLDRLDVEARKVQGQAFAKLTDERADALLAPLRKPWTYKGPEDDLGRFLHAAKEDFLRATFNSREFIAAASRTQRGYNGQGLYWLPLE